MGNFEIGGLDQGLGGHHIELRIKAHRISYYYVLVLAVSRFWDSDVFENLYTLRAVALADANNYEKEDLSMWLFKTFWFSEF